MGKVVDCVEVVLPHPHRKWFVSLWWGVVMDVMVCLSRLCCNGGIVCGLPVVCQNFLENGHP